MRYRNSKKTFIIGILCSVLVFMGVGFALLSTNLNFGSTATLTGNWNIVITNIATKSRVGMAQRDDSANGTKITNDGHSADLVTDFYAPGDAITYTITVVNRGNIGAYLKQVNTTVTDSNEYIDVSNTIEAVEELKKISVGETVTFDVILQFRDIELEETVSDTSFGISITPTFIQESN